MKLCVAIQRAYNEAITPPMAPTLVVLSSEIQKDNSPNAKIPAYKPPSSPPSTHQREGDRQGSAGGAKSPDRGRAFANAGRREAFGRAGRTGGRIYQHRGDERPHEFPATSSPLRSGRGHRLRLHAWLETGGAQASITGPALAKIAAARHDNIDFGGILTPGPDGGAGRRQPRKSSARRLRPMPRRAFRSSSKK